MLFQSMSRTQTDLGSDAMGALPMGVVAGIGSYVASYVAMFVLSLLEGGDVLQQEAWKAAGMIFYNAHNVDITASALGQSRSVNFLGLSSGFGSIPTVVYYLVPVAALVLMGYVVAWRADGGDLASAAIAGATVTGGYLVMVILGTFLFTISVGGASAGPDLVMSVLLAGLAYPIIAGGLGGVIAGVTN